MKKRKIDLKTLVQTGFTSMWKPLGKTSITIKVQIELEGYQQQDLGHLEDVRILYNQKKIRDQINRQLKREIKMITKQNVYSIDSTVYIPFTTRVTLDV